MTYQETLDFLYNALPMYQQIGKTAFKKDLTNTLALCRAINNPQEKFKSIHIAGTNGKGSTSHVLAAILQECGYKIGLYTSPHLKSFTERIKVNGKEIDQEFVVDFVQKIKPEIEVIKPSFFEITVAMAFDFFYKSNVDVAIIEVGLGGRLDSTNVIDPILSLITNIGYDHMELLGDTLPQIAGEKAGIIKRNRPVVISEWQSEIENTFNLRAKEYNAEIIFAAKHYQVKHLSTDYSGATFQIKNGKKIIFPTLLSSLLGHYQARNIPGILAAVDKLRDQNYRIADEQIFSGFTNVIKTTGLKGRWQILSTKPYTVCDVAHNVEGLKLVLDQLNHLPFEKLHLVLGMVKDKNAEDIFKLLPKEANYYFCQAKLPRAKPVEELMVLAEKFDLSYKIIKNVNEAMALAKNSATDQDVVFVGGSSFVVAEIENL